MTMRYRSILEEEPDAAGMLGYTCQIEYTGRVLLRPYVPLVPQGLINISQLRYTAGNFFLPSKHFSEYLTQPDRMTASRQQTSEKKTRSSNSHMLPL